MARGFKIAAINITSLPKCIDQLRTCMLNEPIQLIFVLSMKHVLISVLVAIKWVYIPIYALERNDRNRNRKNDRNRNGGGVALFIRNTIVYKRDKTRTLSDPELRFGYVLQLKNQQLIPFVVTTWYRSCSTTNFLYAFESLQS